ncbi:hypothetical protein [Breoghania sp. L-A4]|uniref:hypothetical protein n=1 Tax=Breoghania sp. L-A4 TaxID=2304600 RepID=UPI000E358AA6|nr:hypothetical protein [Breoghania sp. L-A4]AXS39189.1 hypothetical protein D1F64_02880 [Breoghania sp. L-A4]
MNSRFSKAALLAAVIAGLSAAPAFAAQAPASPEVAPMSAPQQSTRTMTLSPLLMAQASGAQCKRQCTQARAACTARQEARYQPTAICQSEYQKCVAACN